MHPTSNWYRSTLKALKKALMELPVEAWEERQEIKQEIRNARSSLQWCLQYEAMRK